MTGRSLAKLLWLVVAVGVAVKLGIAFTTIGEAYDTESLRIVSDRLRSDPLHVYESGRWPYPPLYFPFILAARLAAYISPLPFHGWVQVPIVMADAALAVLAARWLGSRGCSAVQQIVAAGSISLGPAFIMVSGYHGQIDSLAVLPVVAACVLWDRDVGRRALWCGLLVGVGAGLKTVPILALFALLPSVRSVREAVRLLTVTVTVPIVALLPFVVATPRVVDVLRYNGWPGVGGPSVLVQPGLVDSWLLETPWHPNSLTQFLWDWNTAIVGVAVVGVAALLRRRRTPAVESAVVIFLAVLAVSWTFFFQYVIWALPFLALTERVRLNALVQVTVIVPGILFYLRPWEDPVVADVYKLFAVLLWLVLVVSALQTAGRPRSRASATT